VDFENDHVSVTMSELELTVATAIESADPQLPGGCDEALGSSPADWLPEARAAVLSMVQLLRETACSGAANYAAGWIEAANWMEDQLIDNGADDFGDDMAGIHG
jgi:hypothetical protein